jgi:hypothetical protein
MGQQQRSGLGELPIKPATQSKPSSNFSLRNYWLNSSSLKIGVLQHALARQPLQPLLLFQTIESRRHQHKAGCEHPFHCSLCLKGMKN